jgi:hypothetical protein
MQHVVGYRDFSRWVASDPAWFITRRFSTLNARIILRLQDNVVELEQKLNKLDRDYSLPNSIMQDDDNTHNGSFRLESFDDRKQVIKDLAIALKEYSRRLIRRENCVVLILLCIDSFVNEYSQLASRPQVYQDDINAVRTWLSNHQYAIHDEEAAYIDAEHNDDLSPVSPRTRSWFRRAIEKTSLLRRQPLKAYLSRKPCDPLISEKDQDTVWHNDIRAERLSIIVSGLVGLAMLIVPIWALDNVASNDIKLGIISGFIVLFYIIVGLATPANIYESLVALAAYTAILIVFMQIQ